MIEHDGNGSDPNEIGHVTRIVQTNATGAQGFAATVTETFLYNSSGQIATKMLDVSGGTGVFAKTFAVSYDHDCLGNLIRVTYPLPEVTGVAQVCYSYDRLGREGTREKYREKQYRSGLTRHSLFGSLFRDRGSSGAAEMVTLL